MLLFNAMQIAASLAMHCFDWGQRLDALANLVPRGNLKPAANESEQN